MNIVHALNVASNSTPTAQDVLALVQKSLVGLHSLSWADRITMCRMAAAPLLVIAAALNASQAFLFIGIAGALSDASDGTVARLLNNATDRGAALDSRADAVFYSTVIVGLIMLFPSRLIAEWPLMTTVVLAYGLPILVGYHKFGRITSYHTWLARLSLVILTPAIVTWLWFDSMRLMTLGTFVLVVSAVEELALTFILNHPRDNISHVFHLLTNHLQRREP